MWNKLQVLIKLQENGTSVVWTFSYIITYTPEITSYPRNKVGCSQRYNQRNVTVCSLTCIKISRVVWYILISKSSLWQRSDVKAFSSAHRGSNHGYFNSTTVIFSSKVIHCAEYNEHFSQFLTMNWFLPMDQPWSKATPGREWPTLATFSWKVQTHYGLMQQWNTYRCAHISLVLLFCYITTEWLSSAVG